MKTLTLIAAALFATSLNAQTEITQNAEGKLVMIPQMEITDQASAMQATMLARGISYVWTEDVNDVRIAVFGDANPMEVCELGDNYSDLVISVVYNAGTRVQALCQPSDIQ